MNTVNNDLQSDLLREVAPKKKSSALPKIIVIAILALTGITSFYLFYNSAPVKIVNIPKATTPSTKAIVSPTSNTIQPAPIIRLAPTAKIPVSAAPKTEPTTKITPPPGDLARVVIAEFKKKKGPTNLQQLLKSANEFSTKAMHADAYLLYFFAAKQGSSSAALVLAKMHDPAHYSQQTSMMDQPDLVQAYKWYQQAARGGQATAQKALNNFRAQVEQMATNGYAEAKELYLQWQ